MMKAKEVGQKSVRGPRFGWLRYLMFQLLDIIPVANGLLIVFFIDQPESIKKRRKERRRRRRRRKREREKRRWSIPASLSSSPPSPLTARWKINRNSAEMIALHHLTVKMFSYLSLYQDPWAPLNNGPRRLSFHTKRNGKHPC